MKTPDEPRVDRENGESDPVGGHDAQHPPPRVIAQARTAPPLEVGCDEGAVQQEAGDHEEQRHARR